MVQITNEEKWLLWKETTHIPFGNPKAKPYTIKWEISNLGRARRNGVVKEGVVTHGYICVGGHYLHQLVAMLFVPPVEGKTFVDHIDGNRQNNSASNLRWCTRKENMNYPIARKRLSESKKGRYKGKDNPNFGKKWSEERKSAFSIKQKEMFKNPLVRARLSAARSGSFRVYRKDGSYYYSHNKAIQ